MGRKIFIAVFLCILALPALAQNGRTPIPFAAPVVTPIIIQAPGSYVVTRNLFPTGPGPIIDVAVPFFPGGDVTIDLNGMVLDNSLNFGDPVIRVTVFGSSEVTLRNGTLIGGSAGIEAFGPGRKLVVEDVKISDFSGSAHLGGIHVLDVFNTVIRRCVIMDPAGAGFTPAAIFLDGGLQRQATIEDNLFQNTFDGIDATMSMEISNNRFLDMQPGVFGAAINLDGAESCLITQNTIHGVFAFGPPQGVGIRLNFSSGCKVYNNVITATTGHGIEVSNGSDGNLLLDNVVRRAGGDGIRVEGTQNHIERNTLTANAGFGLRLGAVSFDNNVGRNSAMGNGAGGPPCAPIGFWSPDFCDDPAIFFPLAGPNWTFFDNLMPGAAGTLRSRHDHRWRMSI